MGKGAPDTNPVGTKSGGWTKAADGFWHTDSAVRDLDTRKFKAELPSTTTTATTTTATATATTTATTPTPTTKTAKKK